MEKCILQINDQVNVRFHGLDTETRRKISEKLKFFVPYARHMPAFKLGRWDGKVSFCTVGGMTYLNLLDRILPIIVEQGYEIEVDDRRPPHAFTFPEITEDFLAGTCWPEGHVAAGKPILLRDYQVEAIKRYLDNPQSIQSISTGAGKSQPLWARIKIPGGWTTMGEIRPGDTVSTPDGGGARVVSIHPQGELVYYRLTFKDGRTAEACGDHLWNVYNVDRKKKIAGGGVRTDAGNPWRVLTTHEIITQMARSKRPLAIDLTAPQGDHVDLPVHPYALGCLIGGGSMSHDLTLSSADSFLVERLSKALPEHELVHHRGREYRIHPRVLSKTCSLRRSLGRIGLFPSRAHTQFIPDFYKEASPDQKRALLCGLMDTAGDVCKSGALTLTTVSERLAHDVADTVRSLGGIARIKQKVASRTYEDEKREGSIAYSVRIRIADPRSIVSLPRKQNRISSNYQYSDSLKLEIVAVEEIGTTECQCILVDHPDHLYITDNYVVTHNTLTTAALSKLVEPYGRSIVIVPSKSLVEQTEEDYRNLGLDVGVYYGDRKEWGKTHTISTWQSLVALSKKGEGRDAINKMVAGTICVMVDEVHSAKAAELKDLLTGPLANIPLRWGLTGTVPKEEYEYLALYAGLGPVVGQIRAADLQEKGVLANCQIDVLQLNDDHVDHKTYQDEYKFLTTDPGRLQWVAEYCTTLAESGNTLILVNNIETGKTLADAIPGASFVYGNTKSKDRKKEYKEVQGATNKIIIATYGVAAVGINIPRIFNLVLFEAGKSYTRVIQSVGRGIRKAEDKDKVYIVDLCSSAKFSKKHLGTRKTYYSESDYPFKVHKVGYR